MFNGGSFRFCRNALYGMLGISLILNERDEDCGTIRRNMPHEKFRKGSLIFEIIVFSIGVITFRPLQRERAIPNILSGNCKEIEGMVCDYEKDNRSFVVSGKEWMSKRI